ncbi:MAG: hypothetical protein JWM19_7661 [Actinomycetia bacterium]|nr:hypothetical protein [Actinomycetes bacterium]
MRWAGGLMYAGAAFAAVYGITYGIAIHSTLVADGTHNASYDAGALLGGIIVGLLESGLWLWMAWKTRAGRNWARITSTVFFGLFSVPFVLGLFKLPAVPRGVVIIEWAVGLAALILLWQRESSQFFAAAKQASLGYAAPQQPGYPTPAQPYGQAAPFGQQPPLYGQPPAYGQTSPYGQPPQYGTPPQDATPPPYGTPPPQHDQPAQHHQPPQWGDPPAHH